MNVVRVTYNQPMPYGGLKALGENKEINVKTLMKTNEINLRFFLHPIGTIEEGRSADCSRGFVPTLRSIFQSLA